MAESDESAQVKTAHRKVKSSGAKSRKNLKRPSKKSLDKTPEINETNGTKEVKKAKEAKGAKEVKEAKETKEVKTVKVSEIKTEAKSEKKSDKVKVEKVEKTESVVVKKAIKKSPAKTTTAKKSTAKKKSTTAKSTTKRKKTAKVTDSSKTEVIQVNKKTPEAKIEKIKVEESATKEEPIAKEETQTREELKIETESQAKEEPEKKSIDIYATPAKAKHKILIREAQYKEIEKRPLGENVKVHKIESKPTPQENLEKQAEFWSTLSEQSVRKATIVRPEKPAPVDLAKVNAKMRARTAVKAEPARPKVPASKLKDQAIKKALATTNRAVKPTECKKERVRFTWPRILLALSCTAAAVFAIVYFVSISSPDMSLRVAAMQSGINATYPSFTPREYSLSDIASEANKVSLTFKRTEGGSSYTITEEKTSWDSTALLSNYIKYEYGDDYTAVREQGLTLYIMKDGAAWVNGGILYKLKVNSGTLTKKQIKSIAVSL